MKTKSIFEVYPEYDPNIIYFSGSKKDCIEYAKEWHNELIELLTEQLKTALNYMEVFMIRDEEPLVGENLKTDLYNTRTAIEKANKHLNK